MVALFFDENVKQSSFYTIVFMLNVNTFTAMGVKKTYIR